MVFAAISLRFGAVTDHMLPFPVRVTWRWCPAPSPVFCYDALHLREDHSRFPLSS